MAPIHDFRHVELDKIGKGKRVLKPPGGECSDIFGIQGDQPQVQKIAPRRSGYSSGYMQSTIFGAEETTNGHSSPPCTPSPPNGAAKKVDTQNRLFGPPVEDATPKKVVDRLKSNIFASEETAVNGKSSDHSPTSNGDSPDGANKGRQRNPPGGKCSGIF